MDRPIADPLSWLLVAHRGASRDAPENTLPAFDLAALQGADAIECDVRLSGDGVPVICHDATLERIAGRSNRLDSCTLDELKSISILTHSRYQGTTIPTLAEVLRWSVHGLPLVLELKADGEVDRQVASVASVVQAVPSARIRCFSSFDTALLRAVRQALPDVPRALVVAHSRDVDQLAAECGATEVHASWRGFTTGGLPRIAWTVDRLPTASRLIGLGIAGVMTNRPSRIAALR